MPMPSPDWKKIDRLAEKLYNVLHDEKEGVSFLEIDCILVLLQTQCNTQKYTFILSKNDKPIDQSFTVTKPKNIYG